MWAYKGGYNVESNPVGHNLWGGGKADGRRFGKEAKVVE